MLDDFVTLKCEENFNDNKNTYIYIYIYIYRKIRTCNYDDPASIDVLQKNASLYQKKGNILTSLDNIQCSELRFIIINCGFHFDNYPNAWWFHLNVKKISMTMKKYIYRKICTYNYNNPLFNDFSLETVRRNCLMSLRNIFKYH